MNEANDRILTSHAGTLPRPPGLFEAFLGGESTRGEFEDLLPTAIRGAVERQHDLGLDMVNDGEFSKQSFLGYVRERMSGIEARPAQPGRAPRNAGVNGRDRASFPGFYAAGLGRFYFGNQPDPRGSGGGGLGGGSFCVEPLRYVGATTVATDVERMLAACTGLDVVPFLPAVAPGTIEHWLENDYYPNDEAFLFALADVMHEEYKAITDAGIIVQIDDPDLPDGWQHFPDMSIEEYRRYAELRVDALNHALRDIPEELVRFHICWGSQHGPHRDDLPLAAFIDLVLKVRARCYSIEAANPRHDHEWAIWTETRLPDGKVLMPGVVSHVTDHVEHPELVAQRLIRYAELVGRENVIAGTDCGVGNKVGHAEIAWAKLEELVAGARIASDRLWGT